MTPREIESLRRRLRKLGLPRENIAAHIQRSIAARSTREEKHKEFLRKSAPKERES